VGPRRRRTGTRELIDRLFANHGFGSVDRGNGPRRRLGSVSGQRRSLSTARSQKQPAVVSAGSRSGSDHPARQER
jgi:hypothetical protein